MVIKNSSLHIVQPCKQNSSFTLSPFGEKAFGICRFSALGHGNSTVIVTQLVSLHPFALVTSTQYVVVCVGFAFTILFVVLSNPVLGVQL